MLTGALQTRPAAAIHPAGAGRSLTATALLPCKQHVGSSPGTAWREAQALAGRSFAVSTAIDVPKQPLGQQQPRKTQTGCLMVVESPAKARKIQQYLGDGFTVWMAVRSMLPPCMRVQ